MLSRIRTLRRHLATELGFVVPPVHIADNLRLKPREYVISLSGVEIGRWQTESNQLLAVSADPQARPLARQRNARTGIWRECALDRARARRTGVGGRILRCRPDYRHHDAFVRVGAAAWPRAA